MKIAGIVAEYNPFHNGHAFQTAQLRAQGYDAVVCVMSPSVVQRGTAALYPTEVRTAAALAGGADLVLCLPAPYAVLSAEGFAAAGVAVLSALGCVDALAFGAETPDAALLLRTAAMLRTEAFRAALQPFLGTGASFASARAAAAQTLQPGAGQLLASPNNILAVEYCKAILAQHSPLRPLALARRGAGHDEALSDSALSDGGDAPCASATALRTAAREHGAQALRPYVPCACAQIYERAQAQGSVLEERAFSIAVLSRLRMAGPEQLARVRGMGEGLENRLAAAVRTAVSLPELYDALKTKRYAHARLRRLVLDAALGYTDALPALPPYLHVLGATQTGLAALRLARAAALLPLGDSLAQLAAQSGPAAAAAAAHAAAEDLTALCLASPRPMGAAYTQKFLLR